jgi:hypothetical protein
VAGSPFRSHKGFPPIACFLLCILSSIDPMEEPRDPAYPHIVLLILFLGQAGNNDIRAKPVFSQKPTSGRSSVMVFTSKGCCFTCSPQTTHSIFTASI